MKHRAGKDGISCDYCGNYTPELCYYKTYQQQPDKKFCITHDYRAVI